MEKAVLFFWILIVALGCAQYPADVEWALKHAGENRAELEKVLKHYSLLPEDKLKLKSAFFLIANIPFHFTVRDSKMEAFKRYLEENEITDRSWKDFQKLNGHYSGTIRIEPDVKHVSSEYLIRNIDFSFRVWQEATWGKHISFEIFCEEILPYRIANEPIDYWKEAYYAAFQPIIDTMDHGNRLDQICLHLLNEYHKPPWTWALELNLSGFEATFILKNRYGTCKDVAEFGAYMLRSVGIPSGVDMVIQQPDHNVNSHFWNYTHTLDGKLFGFQMDGNLISDGRWKMRLNGKIYRKCFALQKESLRVKYNKLYVPEGGLRDVLLRDVSFEYCPDTHITAHIDGSVRLERKDLAYLCVFDNSDWIPIAWCKPKRGIAEFRHVEPDILYQIRLINEERDIAATSPFIFHGIEKIQFLDTDMSELQSMTLSRKFRLPIVLPWYHKQSEGGLFQGANTPDFRDSVTLHRIPEPSGFNWMNVKVDHPGEFRYVRYLSSKTGGYNGMAEAEFYSNGIKLTGEVIGTDTSAMTFPNDTKHAVFDGDPLTFFDDLPPSTGWAGLRLDKPYKIDAIRYIYRNDDNNVRKGDLYELFYNRKGEWQSTGIQTADTVFLQYEKIPSKTLYWLRNHTRGKEERPFLYENGKQIFY